MYDELVQLVGTNPVDNPLGFCLCICLLSWFLYNCFNLLYSLLGGTK